MDPAALASGKRRGAAAGEVLGADRAERFASALGPFGSRDAPPGERERHVREHGPARQVGRLERDRDSAVALDPALGGGERPGERVEQRALAGAVGPEQRHDLARAEFGAHVADDIALAASYGQVLAAEQHRPGPGAIRAAHVARAGHVADRNRRRMPLPWCWSTASPHIRTRISAVKTIAIASASA